MDKDIYIEYNWFDTAKNLEKKFTCSEKSNRRTELTRFGHVSPGVYYQATIEVLGIEGYIYMQARD